MDLNYETYSKASTVAHYSRETELQGCEAYVFSKYIVDGAHILDVGVGGGRTTFHLARRAGRYLGVDYVDSMVEQCRNRFNDVEFRRLDASDLQGLESNTFDVVVFSFNGIDTLAPDERRVASLREFRRVLRGGGKLIFSSHNARQFLVMPLLANTDLPHKVWRTIRAVYKSGQLAARMLPSSAFLRGAGYIKDPVHGGLINHAATQEHVTDETIKEGFRLLEVVNGHYPKAPPFFATPWYYYVFERR